MTRATQSVGHRAFPCRAWEQESIRILRFAVAAIVLLAGCSGGPPSAGQRPRGSIDAAGLARLLDEHRGRVVLVKFGLRGAGRA